MYKRELENSIRQNTLASSYMLYGACDYQIDYYGKILSDIFRASLDEAMTFYFDEYDYSSAKSHISQSSLFGDKNILIVKTSKTIPKKELDSFVEICQKNENSFFILQCYDEEKAKNMTKSFGKKKKADFVRFFKPNMGEATQMMIEKAKELNLNIQAFALQHLYALHNENISLSISEFPKLSTLDREVKREDIDHLVYGLGTVGLDDFISKLISGKNISKEFQNILESGMLDEVRIINALQSYITQLFLINTFIKLHGTPDIKTILGYNLPPMLAKVRVEQSRRLDKKQYKKSLILLLERELLLKTISTYDKESLLLSTIINLQKIIKDR